MTSASSGQKSATSRDARFWDKTAEKYSKRPIADQETYEQKLELTQKYFTPDSEILEFGCGTGSTALIHASHVKQVLATDISSAMIEIAESKKQEQGVNNVEFKTSTLLELACEPESFDAVLALNILHLLSDFKAHITRSYELLRPGGVFVSSTVCLTSPFIKGMVALMQLFRLAPNVAFIRASELEKTIIDQGFEIVERLEKQGRITSLFLVARKPDTD